MKLCRHCVPLPLWAGACDGSADYADGADEEPIPVFPDVFVSIKHLSLKFLFHVQNVFLFAFKVLLENNCSHQVCYAPVFTIFTLVLTRTIQCVTIFCYELLCNITHYL